VNILDENIPASQRQLLEVQRVKIRQIGFNIGRRGMHDDEIIPLLLRMRRPTFFTRDQDFYQRRLCHPRYAIAYLAVDKNEVATFVRRFLRHPALNTLAKRLGSVIRVSSAGLSIWRSYARRELRLEWRRGNR
jgi:hypothetical protein